MIECYAIDLLKARNIIDLPQVASVLGQTSNLSRSPDIEGEEWLDYLMAFANFHIALVETAGNSRLIYFYQAISSNLVRYQCMYAYTPDESKNAQEEHEQIMEFITIFNTPSACGGVAD